MLHSLSESYNRESTHKCLKSLKLTRGVTRKAWLCGSLLVRPLRVGSLWVGHLRVRHLRVRTRGKPWASLGEAWLSITSCWWVRSPWGLAIVGRGHTETWLRGSIDVVMKWVGLTHNRVSTLILGHGVGEGSIRNLREEEK